MPPATAPNSWRRANPAPTSPAGVETRLDAPYTATRPTTTSTAATRASNRVSQRRSIMVPPSHLLHQRPERGAPLLVVREHVEARARRRQQHGVAGARGPARAGDHVREAGAALERHRPSQIPLDERRRFAVGDD